MEIDDTVLEDHAYSRSRECGEIIAAKDQRLNQFEAEIHSLQRKIRLLELQPPQAPLSIKRIKDNEKKVDQNNYFILYITGG